MAAKTITATLLPKSTDTVSGPTTVTLARLVYDRGEFKGAWTTSDVFFRAARLVLPTEH